MPNDTDQINSTLYYAANILTGEVDFNNFSDDYWEVFYKCNEQEMPFRGYSIITSNLFAIGENG